MIADSFSHLFSNFQYSTVSPKRNQIFHSMSKSSIFTLLSVSLFLIKTHFELFDNSIFNQEKFLNIKENEENNINDITDNSIFNQEMINNDNEIKTEEINKNTYSDNLLDENIISDSNDYQIDFSSSIDNNIDSNENIDNQTEDKTVDGINELSSLLASYSENSSNQENSIETDSCF